MVWSIQEGWLCGEGLRKVPSPNYDERPCGESVSLLVVHNISLPPGEFGGGHIDAFFSNQLDTSRHPYFEEIKALKVSSHLLIDRRGNVTQYVPFNMRAWHAGASKFNGRERCNDFSIGIELEGTDDQPYEDIQYQVLGGITQLLLLEYPAIEHENIVGHCHIAPKRKTDPGVSFAWSKYLNIVKG